MNLNTLKYVVAVSEERSFTKAAQRLMMSQPTLSLNIKALESQLGAAIFDRTNYPLTLTPAGKLYIEWAKAILLSEAELAERIREANDFDRDAIHLGCAPHRANSILAGIIKVFRESCPDCRIDVITDSTAELYQQLEDGVLDIILDSATDVDKARHNVQFLLNERVYIAVPKSFCAAGIVSPTQGDYPSIRLSQLKDFDFVRMKEDTFLGRTLNELCRNENFIPRAAITCTKVETVGAFAAAGLGVALLSEFYVRNNPNIPETLDYFCVAGANPTRNLSIIHSNGLHISKSMQCFIDTCISMYGQQQ